MDLPLQTDQEPLPRHAGSCTRLETAIGSRLRSIGRYPAPAWRQVPQDCAPCAPTGSTDAPDRSWGPAASLQGYALVYVARVAGAGCSGTDRGDLIRFRRCLTARYINPRGSQMVSQGGMLVAEGYVLDADAAEWGCHDFAISARLHC